MKKTKNTVFVISVIFICSILFAVLFYVTNGKINSVLSSDAGLSILIEQFASAFLLISVIAVLSDKNNVVLWENLIHLKLIEPIGFNLTDLSIYTFYILILSVVSYASERYFLLLILAGLEVVILTSMVFRILQVYFSNDLTRKKLKKKFMKCTVEEKYEKLERLAYKVLEKLNSRDLENLDDDVVFFLIGAEEFNDEHMKNMAFSLIEEISETNVYLLAKIFGKRKEHFTKELSIDGEYDRYIQVRNKYMDSIATLYPNIFKRIQYRMTHEWTGAYLKYIHFCQANFYSTTRFQFPSDPLIMTECMKKYLERYGSYPTLVEVCINHLEKILADEMELRGFQGKICDLTFRNNTGMPIHLMSKAGYDSWMEVLENYKEAYFESSEAEKNCLERCIKGIIWLQYMHIRKKYITKSYFEENEILNVTNDGLEDYIDDEVAKNANWYSRIPLTQWCEYGAPEEGMTEELMASLCDLVDDDDEFFEEDEE